MAARSGGGRGGAVVRRKVAGANGLEAGRNRVKRQWKRGGVRGVVNRVQERQRGSCIERRPSEGQAAERAGGNARKPVSRGVARGVREPPNNGRAKSNGEPEEGREKTVARRVGGTWRTHGRNTHRRA